MQQMTITADKVCKIKRGKRDKRRKRGKTIFILLLLLAYTVYMYSLKGENERRTQVKMMTCTDDGTWM